MAAIFDKHLFISYAHIDNVPLTPEQQGWVSRLHASLDAILSMRLGCKAEIWRDLKLTGSDVFADEIVSQFMHTAVMLSVISPRYIQSDWCKRELREFCELAEHSTGLVLGNRSRAIKVLKLPVEGEEGLPPIAAKMLGYSFFMLDETQAPLELDPAYGESIAQQYNLKVARLAWDIAQMVRQLTAASKPGAAPQTPTRPPVYLAECGFDCRDYREALAAELKMRGYPVLPEVQLPLEEGAYVREVRSLLARCCMSIHLVGSQYGAVPHGPDPRSVVVLQNDLAIERSRASGMPRAIWMPENTASSHPLQQTFIESLLRDSATQFGADLVTASFEDFKGIVQIALKKQAQEHAKAAPAAVTQKLIYIICDERDRAATLPLRKFLRGKGFECSIPAFVGGNAATVREANESLLRQCDAAVVFYGHGDEGWKHTVDSELRKARALGRERPLPSPFIYLADPVTAGKQELVDMQEPKLMDCMSGFDEAAIAELLRSLL